MLKTLYLIIICIVFFHFGAIIEALRDKNKKNRINMHINIKQVYATERALLKIGWVLLFISLLPTFIVLKEALYVVMVRGYFGLYQLEADIGLSHLNDILSAFSIPATFFLLAGSRRSMLARVTSLIVVTVYILIMLFLGWRGKAIMFAVAYIWLWHRQISPLPSIFISVVFFSAFFFLIPLIKIIRNVPGSERLSLSLLLHQLTLLDNPVVETFSEFGITMRNIAFTLDLVPQTRPFAMGSSYLYALLTIIPNLFWDIHPSQAHHLGTWLTSTVAWNYYKAGGGYGFSFLAEAYLNFGWFGLPVVMSLMGYYYTKFTLWSWKQNDPAKIATLACFLSFFLFFARAESMSVIRPLLWYSLVPYGAVRLLTIIPANKKMKI